MFTGCGLWTGAGRRRSRSTGCAANLLPDPLRISQSASGIGREAVSITAISGRFVTAMVCDLLDLPPPYTLSQGNNSGSYSAKILLSLDSESRCGLFLQTCAPTSLTGCGPPGAVQNAAAGHGPGTPHDHYSPLLLGGTLAALKRERSAGPPCQAVVGTPVGAFSVQSVSSQSFG